MVEAVIITKCVKEYETRSYYFFQAEISYFVVQSSSACKRASWQLMQRCCVYLVWLYLSQLPTFCN